MKILRLDLAAFGPFQGTSLDLSAGRAGLHLIYGPNEAGKSSALRALEYALFGIPARCSDNFLHPYPDLRIGLTLASRDGRSLAFVRRKAAKNTLLSPDDGATLPEDSLTPYLGTIDRELFTTMFGIDHEQLIRGGRDIVNESSSVGQLLFAAGAGIAELQSVQSDLEAKAALLFTARGKKQTLNVHLHAVEDVRKSIRNSQLSSEAWTRAEQSLAEARRQCERIDEELRAIQVQRHKWERIRQALPLASRLAELRRQLAALGDVPRLSAGFAEQRRRIAEEAVAVRLAVCAAEAESARIDEELAKIIVPETLLTQADSIATLPDRVGAYRKAQRDLPGIDAQRRESQRVAEEVLREVRPDATLEQAESLLLTVVQRETILSLIAEFSGVTQQEASTRSRTTQLAQRHEAATAAVEQTAAPPDVASLQEAVRRVRAQGDLDDERIRSQAELSRLRGPADAALQRLPGWSGDAAALESAPLPAAATVERFEAALRAETERIERARTRLDEWRLQCSEVARLLEELELQGDVPSEEDLIEARRRRDQGWRFLAAKWQGEEPDAAACEAFVAGDGDLPTAYERSVRAADEIADRLRREAHRAAQWASLVARRNALANASADVEREPVEAEESRRRTEAEWEACWAPAGVRPGSPREMLTWLTQAGEALRGIEAVRRQEAVAAQAESRGQQARATLLEALASVASDAENEAASISLPRLLALAESRLAKAEQAAADRAEVIRELRRIETEAATARSEWQHAQQEEAAWKTRWASAISPLGLSADASPDAVGRLLERLRVLASKRELIASDTQRIDDIRCEAERFAESVRGLSLAVAPDLVEMPCDQAADALTARLAAARRDRDRVRELTERRVRHHEAYERHANELKLLEARLATMCCEAGCVTPEELPKVEQARAQASALEDRAAAVEEQLAVLAAGVSLDEFTASIEACNADELPVQCKQLDESIERLDAERAKLHQGIGSDTQALAAMNGGDGAVEAASQYQDLLAKIENDGTQYVRLRLAGAILREGIERYRKKNEGPVLRRASELFQRLTRGSFDRLTVDVNDEGRSVLMGVRPEGDRRVELHGMSEGTADQLYLALRLAALENYLDGKEPVPLILDDVLVSFDDERAATALEVLAECSRRTQVVFFTHHDHLVDLAKRSKAADEIFTHRLSAVGR